MSEVVWKDIKEKVNSILELAGYPSKWIEFVWKKIEDFELYQLDTWNEYGSDIEFIDVHIRIAVLIRFYLEFKTSYKDNDSEDIRYRLGYPFTSIDNIYIFFLTEYIGIEFYRLRNFCKLNLNVKFSDLSQDSNYYYDPENDDKSNYLISESIYDFAEKIYIDDLNYILSIIFINESNLFKSLVSSYSENINDLMLSNVDINKLIYNNKKSWNWLTMKTGMQYLNRSFSEISFNLLEEISSYKSINYAVFQDKFREIELFIERPLQKILKKVCVEISESFSNIFNLEAQVYKYEEGIRYLGCVYHWDCESIGDARLFIIISSEQLYYGLFLPETSKFQQKFIDNCKNNIKLIIGNPNLSKIIRLCKFNKKSLGIQKDTIFLDDWLKASCEMDVDGKNIQCSEHLKKDILLNSSEEDIVKKISNFFESILGLIILAFNDDPIPLIKECCKPIRQINLPLKIIKSKPILPIVYTIDQFLEDTSITPKELDRYEKTIKRKKQIILAGSPGTGKTFIAQKFAKYLTSVQNGYVDLVQFHPSYTYEDFMRGLKPEIKDGSLTYNYAEGRFIQFCEKAQTKYQDLPCVFIIDEINRANISQVFGELMYLLEYRNAEITLSSGKTFTIPDNVLIIGTMNTADRSIALIDHALRRRFAFIKITPNYQSLRNRFQDSDFPIEKLITVLQGLNQKICEAMGSNDYELGTSFFMTDNLSEEIEDIWQMEVEPYLEEYFFDNQSQEIIESFRWINVQKQIY